MIVITLNACPPALRGDLTKWLFEINTGIYVGNISARVRDKLWERICSNVKDGRATMVFSTNNEQRFDFRVHNTDWQPTDFDGLKLMMRPVVSSRAAVRAPNKNFSRASKFALSRNAERSRLKTKQPVQQNAKVIIDLETTGLSEQTANIIEICALEVNDDAALNEYHAYIHQETPLPPKIIQLTGITDETLRTQGIPQRDALIGLLKMIDKKTIVSHNVRFDMRFLRAACQAEQLPIPRNTVVDTLALAKDLLQDLPNYRLSTVAKHLKISAQDSHNSRSDCATTFEVFKALTRLQSQ